MASLTESSIASVPSAHLRQLREHLLRLPQLSGASAQSETLHQAAIEAAMKSTAGDTSGEDVDTVRSPTISPTKDNLIADDARRSPRFRKSITSPVFWHRPRPRLSPTKSAPGGREMEAMIQQSPSQEAFCNFTRGVSFHGYPGGDTQPMESQVYRQFNESVVRPALTTPNNVGKSQAAGQDDEARRATEATIRTLGDGDHGYVSLDFQPRSPSIESQSEAEYENALVSSQLESQRMAPPQTPAIAGSKRKRDGEYTVSEPPTTTTKTPDFSRFFGAMNAPVLSATQLFNQTQERSSPVPDFPRSDPIITRPSPGMHALGRSSPPPASTSSPLLSMHSRPATAIGEPRATYMSMKESQERRRARSLEINEPHDMRMGQNLEARNGRHFIPAQEGLQVQPIRNNGGPQARAEAKMHIRPAFEPSPSPSEYAVIDLETPWIERKRRSISLNSNSSDDSGETDRQEHFSAEISDQGGSGGEEGNDQYDEFQGEVLKSQQGHLDAKRVEEAKDDIAVPTALHGSHEAVEMLAQDTTLVQHSSLQREVYNGLKSDNMATQHTTVANSVPGTQERQHVLQQRNTRGTPSTGSVVPGSQYDARAGSATNQPSSQHLRSSVNDISIHAEVNKSKRPSSSQGGRMRTSNDDMVPEDSAEASSARRKLLSRRHTHLQQERQMQAVDRIPDSDAIDGLLNSTPVQGEKLLKDPTFHDNTHNANRTGLQSDGLAVASPAKVLPSQTSGLTEDTPRKAAGIPHFDELFLHSMPPTMSKEVSYDIDEIMDDVNTEEDRQVFAITASPPRPVKRRRLQVHPPRPSQTDQAASHISLKGSHGALERPNIDQDSEADQPHLPCHINEPVASGELPLRSSPSKANELPSATPPVSKNATFETPESVRRRESAGAQAVGQLLSARSRKAAKSKASRKAALFKVKGKKKRQQRTGNSLSESAKVESNSSPSERVEQRETIITDQLNHLDHSQLNDIAIPQDQSDLVRNLAQDGYSAIETIAPARVFAFFGGKYGNFYPATWLSTSLDGQSYKVKYDDNSIIDLPATLVRRLELRVGDQVKVDEAGLRDKLWFVKGFANPVKNKQHSGHGIDTRGYQTLKVQAKAPRSSRSGIDELDEAAGNVVDVAVQAIYLTRSMFRKFDREFTALAPTSGPQLSRLSTPVGDAATSVVETPGSRTRRTNSALLRPGALHVSRSCLREGSVASSASFAASGLFSGMVFAISYSSNEREKAQVTKLIKQNGGTILESGFEELFVLPHLSRSTVMSSPKPQNAKQTEGEADPEASALQIKPEYADAGFVALIADRHSRRAKYMQALALGLPTLSGRWVLDSVAKASKPQQQGNTTSDLPWSRYLLASGESAYLAGAVRSRVLSTYSAAESKLEDVIQNREILLHGDGVLIVAPKKGKKGWEKSNTYAFLTLALGASSVKRVSDLEEARALADVEADRWKWLYVDGSIEQAQEVFSTAHKAVQNTKQKSKRSTRLSSVEATVDRKVRIVNDEFVVQSLILGALVD